MGELNFCNFNDIFQAMNTQILSDITTDGGLPLLLVRLLHNKLISIIFNSSRCYLLYFDASQLIVFISPILYPFILYALFGKKWRRKVWFIFLLFPIIFMYFSPPWQIGSKIIIFKLFYMYFAVIGFIKVLKLFPRSISDN